MANVQAPFGLRLIETEGKQVRVRRYVKKSGNAIYEGDAVIQASTGDVDVATAGATILGVAMEYKAATNTDNIAICDDPDAMFEIQASNNVVAADVFQNCDIVATTGDTAKLTSKHSADQSTFGTGSTKQLKILGLSAISDNAYGSYARLKVKINTGVFKAGTSGV